VDEALQKVGLSFKDFKLTDNSCRAAETKIEEIKNDLVFVESKVATGVQSTEQNLFKEVTKDVSLLETEVEMIAGTVGQEVVKDVVAIEKELVKDVVAVEKEIVKDVVGIESEVVKDEQKVQQFFGSLFKR